MPVKNQELKKGAIIRFNRDCELYTVFESWNGISVQYSSFDIMEKTTGMGPDQIPTFETGNPNMTYLFTHQYNQYRGNYWTALLKVVQGSVKAGDRLTVKNPSTTNAWLSGNHFTATIDNSEYHYHISLESVKEAADLEKVSDDCHFVIHDPNTGMYFQKMDISWKPDPNNPSISRFTNTPVWTDKVGKANKFKDTGKLKMFIINNCGYYTESELQASTSMDMTDYENHMTFGGKVMDFQDTWQVVAFNKTTKKQVSTNDLSPWWKRTNLLKAITTEYGSSTRKIVDRVDKKPNGTTHILVLRRSYPIYDYDNDKIVMESMIKEIKKLNSGVTHSQELDEVPTFTISVPLKDENEALMILLSISNYTGWETRVVEIATLQSKILNSPNIKI